MTVRGLGGYFGERVSCYGFLHPSPQPTNQAVLVINDIGYRGLCAYWTFRRLAARLAAAGATVLRFDLPGTGDSPSVAGDRVAQWGVAVEEALALLAAQPGVEALGVVGYGLGATLAFNGAQANPAVKWATLIEPFASGASYLSAVGGPALPGGRLVDSHAITQAEEASLSKLTAAFGPRAEALDLEVVALASDAAKAFAQQAELAQVPCRLSTSSEGERLTTDPLYNAKVPGFFDQVVERLAQRHPAPRTASTTHPLRPTHQPAGLGYREEVLVCPEEGVDQHGILALPETTRTPHALVLVFGTSANRRTGIHDNNTLWARALAKAGVATMRFDVSGFGDSEPRGSAPDNETLVTRNYTDAAPFVAEARRRGFTELGVFGLSSGGFNAFPCALGEPSVRALLGLNTARFVLQSLEDYDRTNVKNTSTYVQAILDPETWARLFKGNVNVRHITGALYDRLRKRAETKLKLLRSRLTGAEQEVVLGQGHQEMLELLRRPRTQVKIVYAEGDRYIEELEKQFGTRGAVLSKHPNCEVTFLPSMDHSMQAPADAERVAKLAVDFFVGALA